MKEPKNGLIAKKKKRKVISLVTADPPQRARS